MSPQKQNEKLSDDLALLKQQLRATEENTQRRIQSALRESQTTVAAVRESEERSDTMPIKYCLKMRLPDLRKHWLACWYYEWSAREYG